jgi:hypothetical protein
MRESRRKSTGGSVTTSRTSSSRRTSVTVKQMGD